MGALQASIPAHGHHHPVSLIDSNAGLCPSLTRWGFFFFIASWKGHACGAGAGPGVRG